MKHNGGEHSSSGGIKVGNNGGEHNDGDYSNGSIMMVSGHNNVFKNKLYNRSTCSRSTSEI